MFTGIVEHLGTVLTMRPTQAGSRLRIDLGPLRPDAIHGASFAVDGTCLTVAAGGDTWAEFDVIGETLSRTTLGGLRPGDPVNLERALAANGRLDGHFVQGHVDATATVTEVTRTPSEVRLAFTLDDPGQIACVVPKGSIAVSGVSLTVVDVQDATFSIALIPTTLAKTTLAVRKVGDKVNVETDMLAKVVINYLMRTGQSSPAAAGGLTFDQLRESGWL